MADAFDPQHAERLGDPARLEALPRSAVVSLLRLDGAETVVDYGAGTGVYTIGVAQAVPGGRVVAVEALPRLAQMLREKITPDLAGRLEVVETDANAVPLADGAADRVVMVDVLHHLYDQPGALDEVVRLLRPGGLFVVLDWGDRERPAASSRRWDSRRSRHTSRARISRTTWRWWHPKGSRRWAPGGTRAGAPRPGSPAALSCAGDNRGKAWRAARRSLARAPARLAGVGSSAARPSGAACARGTGARGTGARATARAPGGG